MKIIPHWIGGKPLEEETSHTSVVYNPALGESIAQVYHASDKQCDETVQVAVEAYKTWSETPAVKRAQVLFKFRELLEKYQADLARIVTREHGKTIDDAKGSILRAIEVVALHCGILSQLQTTFSSNVANQIDCVTVREPLGVCMGVSPFNFPVMVPVWMMVPAIACGNTFILKPSEQDPSPVIQMMHYLSDAGLPGGVVNVLQGGQQTVQKLIQHQDIKAVTAVASTPVAEAIYQQAIQNGKRAHTFGGAKNHAVVMPDAPIEQTADALIGAAFGSAGERCMAISVAVAVGDDVAERLLKALIPKIRAIKVDTGEAKQVDMGPLISRPHHERVLAAIDQGIEEGAELVIDGRSFRHSVYPQGYFMGPSLFDRVTEKMDIYQKEVFGPVLVMIRVADFEEAIALVNRHQYGNGTAIFTREGYFAREYTRRVQVGMVGVNIPIPVPVASHPFGGWKRSCFGDTNMHGTESIHFYTRLKTITSRWPRIAEEQGNAFIMPTH